MESFTNAGTATPPTAWWTVFGDDQLDQWMHAAFAGNVDLRTAWHRLQAAEATAIRESAQRFPSAAARVRGSRQQDEGDTDEEIELGLSASYEADLWGGLQARADAERLAAEATAFDFQAAALSLSAEIAQTWVDLLTSREQLALLERQVTANQGVLHLLERRFAGGQSRSVDLLRQRQLLADTRRELQAETATRELLEHRLAILVGQPPRPPLDYQATSLPDLPPLPETGVPLALVQRRPDVLAAQARLASANRETAVAVSTRFPRIAVSASYTTQRNDVESLFDDWVLSLAGNLVAPLVDAGRRRADLRRATAEEQESLYAYAGAVLAAYREVEDALVLERQQQRQAALLEEQVRTAARVYTQLQTEYLNGTGDFIDVLAAQIDEQGLRREAIRAERRLLEIRINLYRALAGSLDLDLKDSP